MELSKLTVNYAKFTQFAHPCPESHEIRAIHANFLRFSVSTCKTVNIRALLYLCRFRAVHTGLELTQAGAN